MSYVARWVAPDGSDHSESFDRRAKADARLAGIEAAKESGTYIDPAKGRELLGDFYARTRLQAKLAPSTAAKYDGVWKVHVAPVLGSRRLAAITRADVKNMVNGITSPYQAAEALKLLRALLNRALDEEAVGRNAAARVAAPEIRRAKVRVLTPAELDAVVEELPERWRALAILGGYASLRWSELVAVRRDDLDLEACTVRVDEKVVEVRGRFEWGEPKTPESNRTVDLPALVVRPLAEHLLRFPSLHDTDAETLEGLVFYGEGGGPVRRHVFRPIWRDACLAAGVEPIRVEWLRHTGASIAYLATKDMKLVSERLGRTSVRMMDTVYVKTYAEASRSVADAIDAVVQASRSAPSSRR